MMSEEDDIFFKHQTKQLYEIKRHDDVGRIGDEMLGRHFMKPAGHQQTATTYRRLSAQSN